MYVLVVCSTQVHFLTSSVKIIAVFLTTLFLSQLFASGGVADIALIDYKNTSPDSLLLLLECVKIIDNDPQILVQ